jgi:hypothetical protein
MNLSLHVRTLPFAALLAVCFAASLPAGADVTLGASARDVAMGGAGLASGDAQGASTNPAFLADSGVLLGIIWPSVSTSTSGAVGLTDAIKLIGSAGVDADDAWKMLQELGQGPTTIEVSAHAGLALPRADLLASSTVRTEITPNEDFSDWLASDMAGDMPATARADVYSGGIATLPSLGFGFHLPEVKILPGKTSVGFRVKPTQIYYSHYVFDPANPDGAPADEMGGKSYLKNTSVSADAGVTFTPRAAPNLHFAVMVNNLLEPGAVRFATPSERFGAEKQLAPRTVSVGTAWVNENITLAADLVDLTGKYGDSPQLRLGGEYRMLSGLALRGGYNTKNGVTAGIGLGSFGIAFSDSLPVMLSHTVAF